MYLEDCRLCLFYRGDDGVTAICTFHIKPERRMILPADFGIPDVYPCPREIVLRPHSQ